MFSPLLFISPNDESCLSTVGEHDIGWLDEFGNENVILTARDSNSPVYYEINTEFEKTDVFGLARICRISLPYDLGYKMNFDVTLLDYPEYKLWRDTIAFWKRYVEYMDFIGRFR